MENESLFATALEFSKLLFAKCENVDEVNKILKLIAEILDISKTTAPKQS